MLKIFDLKCDYQKSPKALATKLPVFSWKVMSDNKDVIQKQYRILLWKNNDILCWDSLLQVSNNSSYVRYEGMPFEENTHYTWQVMITDNYDEKAVSEKESFTTSYYELPWQASWITTGIINPKKGERPVDVFRKEFSIEKRIRRATIRVSAMGIYKLFINGNVVSEDCFTPGYTSYNEYIQYQTYDVTDFITSGTQNITVFLANGWFCGRIMFKSNVYGECTALISETEIEYEDGSSRILVTDEEWQYSTDGPIRFADFYDGEIYDANKQIIPEDSFKMAKKLKLDSFPKLEPHFGTMVRRMEKIQPISLNCNKNNEYIYDLGQNFTGWVRLKVKAEKGDVIRVYHSEILDENGSLQECSHNGAKSILEYICRGGSEETYEPSFTSMGFRYVKLEGLKNPDINTITGIAAYSDMELTGDFKCSNEKINKLWNNVLWSQKSNFLEIPTDCPQRSERLGWLGDIALFSRTASFNMDILLFIRKWLTDLRVEFNKYGKISMVTPDIGLMGSLRPPIAGWGDAAVIVPWTVYLAYGDKEILELQYESMKKWVETEKAEAAKKHKRGHKKYIWNSGFQFGDWMAPEGNIFTWMKKKGWLSTAFFAYSTNLLAKTAEILGKDEDAHIYNQLYNDIRCAFIKEFVLEDGSIKKEFQSAYACALYFDLITDELKIKAAKRLAEMIKNNNGCLATGFLGTPFLTFALSDNNQIEAAYKLLLNEKCPSWLYPINHGATTTWECWDLIREDDTLKGSKDGKKLKNIRSFNHYAYGSVCDWLYRRVAGLEPIEAGYSYFLIKPMPGGGLDFCSLNYKSVFGEIKVFWKIENNTFKLEVSVPANTRARVVLPNRQVAEIGSGNRMFKCEL